jgi:3-hydroxyisobutyrate dehydrogenase-like beta-hydroxyacid dehydrogenase
VLDALSKKVTYVGARAGDGKAIKLVTNLMNSMNRLVVTESLCFALKQGIDPNVVLEVIRGSNASSVAFERYGPSVFRSEKGKGEAATTVEAGGEGPKSILKKHSWQLKDLGLAVKTADELGAPLPLGCLSLQITKAAFGEGESDRGGNDDSAAGESFESIVKYYRKMMKL